MTTTPRSTPGMPVMVALTATVVAFGFLSAFRWTSRVDDAVATNDPSNGATAWPDMRVDINSASVGELSLLPGLGENRAQMIVDERQRNGRFANVDDLQRVRGLGDITIERLKPYAVASSAPQGRSE